MLYFDYTSLNNDYALDNGALYVQNLQPKLLSGNSTVFGNLSDKLPHKFYLVENGKHTYYPVEAEVSDKQGNKIVCTVPMYRAEPHEIDEVFRISSGSYADVIAQTLDSKTYSAHIDTKIYGFIRVWDRSVRQFLINELDSVNHVPTLCRLAQAKIEPDLCAKLLVKHYKFYSEPKHIINTLDILAQLGYNVREQLTKLFDDENEDSNVIAIMSALNQSFTHNYGFNISHKTIGNIIIYEISPVYSVNNWMCKEFTTFSFDCDVVPEENGIKVYVKAKHYQQSLVEIYKRSYQVYQKFFPNYYIF